MLLKDMTWGVFAWVIDIWEGVLCDVGDCDRFRRDNCVEWGLHGAEIKRN